MGKKYLIEADKAEWQTHDDLLLKKAEGKEVEVLDEHDIEYLLTDMGCSVHTNLTDYLKANNLLIVKIKSNYEKFN